MFPWHPLDFQGGKGICCACPTRLPGLLAAEPGFLEGNPGAGLGGRRWGPARTPALLGVQRRAEVPHRGAWAERVEGCSGRGWGRNGGGFRQRKGWWVPLHAPAAFLSPSLGMGSFQGERNPRLAGLKIAKPGTQLCRVGRAAPWLVFLIIIYFFQAAFCC